MNDFSSHSKNSDDIPEAKDEKILEKFYSNEIQPNNNHEVNTIYKENKKKGSVKLPNSSNFLYN